jgi:hypothetical protein
MAQKLPVKGPCDVTGDDDGATDGDVTECSVTSMAMLMEVVSLSPIGLLLREWPSLLNAVLNFQTAPEKVGV